jgi:hypothetical protein
MSEHLNAEEQKVIQKTIASIHEQGWGLAFGLVLAAGLLVATNVLVIQGGHLVGPHLSLLRWYFPGYSVTFVGSLIGAVYAFVIGYGLGRTVATIYNRLTVRMR